MDQNEKSIRAAYDEVATTYADHFRANVPEQPIELDMIRHFVEHLAASQQVLDAGCGPGRMMPVLASYGCQVTGVDLSPAMIRRARAEHSNFETVVGSLTQLPYADSTFDGVFSWYSTIHTPDAELPAALGEFRRVVRPGGLVLVGFQEGHGVRNVAEAFRPYGHEITLHRFRRTADEMSAHLQHAGINETARLILAGDGEHDGGAVLIGQT